MEAREPQVLLIDEPSSALDPIATAAIVVFLLNPKSSYTIVFVT